MLKFTTVLSFGRKISIRVDEIVYVREEPTNHPVIKSLIYLRGEKESISCDFEIGVFEKFLNKEE